MGVKVRINNGVWDPCSVTEKNWDFGLEPNWATQTLV